MNQYTYFVLGILLGIGLAVFYFMNREEKIEKQIEMDQKIYSTKKFFTFKIFYDRITNCVIYFSYPCSLIYRQRAMKTIRR